MTSSLEVTDQESEAVRKGAPRVTLDDIKANIGAVYYKTGEEFIDEGAELQEFEENLEVLTVAVVVLKNGFTVIGKSAPASPENFDAELGKKFAYEDAIRQVWPLMGYALRDRLSNESR